MSAANSSPDSSVCNIFFCSAVKVLNMFFPRLLFRVLSPVFRDNPRTYPHYPQAYSQELWRFFVISSSLSTLSTELCTECTRVYPNLSDGTAFKSSGLSMPA